MVASRRLFKHVVVRLQLRLALPRGAVDARQHGARLVAAPVRARRALNLHGGGVYCACGRHVRPRTQVPPVLPLALLADVVDRDGRVGIPAALARRFALCSCAPKRGRAASLPRAGDTMRASDQTVDMLPRRPELAEAGQSQVCALFEDAVEDFQFVRLPQPLNPLPRLGCAHLLARKRQVLADEAPHLLLYLF